MTDATSPADQPSAGALTQGAPQDGVYRDSIRTLFENRSNVTISNGTSEHAAMLFELFFQKAQDKVVIFCKDLAKSVFDAPHVIAAARDLLQNGKRIEIITQEQPESVDFVSMGCQHGNFQLTVAKKPVVEQITVNFAVMDDRAFRFEPNRHECKAKARMFDPEMSLRLLQMYKVISLMATPDLAA